MELGKGLCPCYRSCDFQDRVTPGLITTRAASLLVVGESQKVVGCFPPADPDSFNSPTHAGWTSGGQACFSTPDHRGRPRRQAPSPQRRKFYTPVYLSHGLVAEWASKRLSERLPYLKATHWATWSSPLTPRHGAQLSPSPRLLASPPLPPRASLGGSVSFHGRQSPSPVPNAL